MDTLPPRALLAQQVECLWHAYRRPHRGFQAERSAFGEELLLLPTLLRASAERNGGRYAGGTFVELGALDGVTISNSLLLERCFNWRGVLIEANPTNFMKLNVSQRASTKIHSAVCAEGGNVTMTSSGGPTSAQIGAASERHVKTWKLNLDRVVTVPCRPLSRIMEQALPAPHHASFLSLDVEGAEDIVMETVDPALFDVVLVEWTDGSEGDNEKNRRVHRRLTNAGLRFASDSFGERFRGSRVYLNRKVRAYPVTEPTILSELNVAIASLPHWRARNLTVEARYVALIEEALQSQRTHRVYTTNTVLR